MENWTYEDFVLEFFDIYALTERDIERELEMEELFEDLY